MNDDYGLHRGLVERVKVIYSEDVALCCFPLLVLTDMAGEGKLLHTDNFIK